MKIHGWCGLHDKMVDKKKFKNQCHRPKHRRCKFFSYQVPEHMRSHKNKAEGSGEFRGSR